MKNDKDTTLSYTWDERPIYVPLTEKEVRLALKIADYDAEKAADILKIPSDRLMSFVKRHPDLRRAITLRTEYPFISIRENDDGCVVITVSPNKRFDTAKMNPLESGGIDIVLYRDNPEMRHILSVAQSIVDEKK